MTKPRYESTSPAEEGAQPVHARSASGSTDLYGASEAVESTRSLAHDLNNLFMIVLGQLEWIEHRGKSSASVRDAAQRAAQAARNGALLAEQILRPRGEDAEQFLELSALVKTIIDWMRPFLGHQIEVHLQLAQPSPWVYLKRQPLEHALLNLLFNARDAIHGQGLLRIGTQQVSRARLLSLLPQTQSLIRVGTLSCKETQYALLSVEDSGCGISTHTLERIFHPGFSTKAHGHGLGMSMIRRFVEHHLGVAFVYSELKRGTQVLIALPEHAPAEKSLRAL